MLFKSLPVRTLLSAVALVLCWTAVPATADCFDDAHALYDSCVDFQFYYHGTLLQPSEEGCAEISAEAVNGCLQAAGKATPRYNECRLRYNFYVTGPGCSTGWYWTESAAVHLEIRHTCPGYQFGSVTVDCS